MNDRDLIGEKIYLRELTVEDWKDVHSYASMDIACKYHPCDPRIRGSAKVLQKIGMMKGGHLRENVLLRNGWRDSYLFSVFDKEWRK